MHTWYMYEKCYLVLIILDTYAYMYKNLDVVIRDVSVPAGVAKTLRSDPYLVQEDLHNSERPSTDHLHIICRSSTKNLQIIYRSSIPS